VNTDEFELVSPCIGVCYLDPATQLCRGCYRTVDEIAAWSAYTNEERVGLLKELRERRRVAGQDRRRVNARRAQGSSSAPD
jgi:predicted Fe-S protein YdhL (DUF1289 family)